MTVIAGSRVRIDTARGTFREWVATVSEGVEVRPDPDAQARFLSVIVVPDAAPSLRIVAPGKDTAFATGRARCRSAIDSRDDLGLGVADAALYEGVGRRRERDVYRRARSRSRSSGAASASGRGRASWPLDGLGLADGDILVYRAIARDTNPAGSPVQSDAVPDRDRPDRGDRGRRIRAADRREEVRDQPADGDLQDRAADR